MNNEPHFDFNNLNKTISGVRLADFKSKSIHRLKCKATYDDWGVIEGQYFKVRYKEHDSPSIGRDMDLKDFYQWQLDNFEIIYLD